jgi:hypothetical protein
VTRSPVPPPPDAAAAQPAGQPTSTASHQGTGGAAPSVRAQLLATEHWSLLATRSTTQSEVLSRITTFLMLVSASIVSLALIGQATRFDRRFITFALVLLGMVLMIGALTQMRLGNAAFEDLAHVIWQPFASSTAFIMLVNSGLTGVFAALVAVALDAPGPLVATVAAACGLAFLGISAVLDVRRVQRMNRSYVSLFPAPSTASTGRDDSQAVAEETQA